MTAKRDWRGEALEHLRRSWPSWLTAYDIARAIRGPGRFSGGGSGRDASAIRDACGEMSVEGLLDRREIRPEGAPYGRPALQFRYRQ